MTALSEPERLVHEALEYAYRRGEGRDAHVTTSRARDLVAALRPLLAADPEIVHGAQAATVPNGTLLIRCTTDGEPFVDHTAFRMDGFVRPTVLGSSPQSYRVLYRAPAPAPKVGDVVHTEDELERLPERSVLRSQVGAKNILERRSVDGTWRNTAGQQLDTETITAMWLPARVLDLGGDP